MIQPGIARSSIFIPEMPARENGVDRTADVLREWLTWRFERVLDNRKVTSVDLDLILNTFPAREGMFISMLLDLSVMWNEWSDEQG